MIMCVHTCLINKRIGWIQTEENLLSSQLFHPLG